MTSKKTRIEWKCDASVYSKVGTIYSTTLKATNQLFLEKVKDEFIEKQREGAEVITFGNDVSVAVTVHEPTSRKIKLVDIDDITNPYISEGFKESL